jgi:MarR family 2-MHQ and catechol resistance regulon transcriptional repressor
MKKRSSDPIHVWLVLNKALQAITRYAVAGIQDAGLGDSDFRVLDEARSSFVETRERLNQKVQLAPGNAKLLSNLAVIDALLARKQDAIVEAQRAVEMLSISQDAIDGSGILMNLAVVYAWTDEPNLAFEKLALLTRTPHGLYQAN